MEVEGRAWVFGHDISTDLLYPQVAYALPLDEAAKMVFSANRPGWSDEVAPGDLIVAGRNFGTGSSRQATALLRRLGLGGCLAESFTNLFLRNCVNFALPGLPAPGVLDIVEEGDVVRADLARGRVENRTTGATLEAAPLPPELLQIIGAGGVMASLEAQGLVPPADNGGTR